MKNTEIKTQEDLIEYNKETAQLYAKAEKKWQHLQHKRVVGIEFNEGYMKGKRIILTMNLIFGNGSTVSISTGPNKGATISEKRWANRPKKKGKRNDSKR